MSELVAAAMKPPTNPANAGMLDWQGSQGWFCADRPSTVYSVATGMAALEAGTFPQGVARMERLADKITAPDPVSIRRKITRGDHGDELEMSRVWQGDLENAWSRAARQAVPSVSRVLLGVALDAACTLASEAMAWRGVAAVALCDALERNGYSVELRGYSSGDYCTSETMPPGTARHDLSVTIKTVGQPMDVHKAAALLASSVTYRACIIRHSTVHSPFKIRSGHTLPRAGRIETPQEPGYDFAALVPETVTNQAAAQRWITETVEGIDARQRGE
jgi:hypothetical protein